MLSVTELSKRFKSHQILSGVSFEVGKARIVGLVGRSGSGKSTIARCILGLERPDGGDLLWHGRSMSDRTVRRRSRRAVQAVFQDPRSSLNPRWTVRRLLSEPLDNWFPGESGAKRQSQFAALLDRVALTTDLLDRYPHELSTGQCQRVCIARALAPEPELLVLDEPLSALDVSVQARLIDLLLDLHMTTGISYLLITHDFAVVSDICGEIVVLDQGQVVEKGSVEGVLGAPSHVYTRSLLQDVLPMPDWQNSDSSSSPAIPAR